MATVFSFGHQLQTSKIANIRTPVSRRMPKNESRLASLGCVTLPCKKTVQCLPLPLLPVCVLGAAVRCVTLKQMRLSCLDTLAHSEASGAFRAALEEWNNPLNAVLGHKLIPFTSCFTWSP